MAEQKNKPSGWEIVTDELLGVDVFVQGEGRPGQERLALDESTRRVREWRFRELSQISHLVLKEPSVSFWQSRIKNPITARLEDATKALIVARDRLGAVGELRRSVPQSVVSAAIYGTIFVSSGSLAVGAYNLEHYLYNTYNAQTKEVFPAFDFYQGKQNNQPEATQYFNSLTNKDWYIHYPLVNGGMTAALVTVSMAISLPITAGIEGVGRVRKRFKSRSKLTLKSR